MKQMTLPRLLVLGIALLSVETFAHAERPLNRAELMSISRASEHMGRVAVWEGQTAQFRMQFGPELISWFVVVAPTDYNRRGRVSCGIGAVTAWADGTTVYPTYVGQLPAHGGVQAYYRLNQGAGRNVESIHVGVRGQNFIHDNCPINVHVVRGAFQASADRSVE